MLKEKYLEEGKYIWKNYVPKSGQAETVQGEMLRAIEKLRDEAQRNGNGNYNNFCHRTLIEYLSEKLNDSKVFNQSTLELIKSDLNNLKKAKQPYLEDDIYNRIGDRIVDWYKFYGAAINHEINPALKC